MAVILPLSSSVNLSIGAEAAIAVALGFGFGFSLERAGFGSARRLTSVFYLYDMSVVKVMFTAIVTAMTGLWIFSAIGILQLPEIYLEPTNYTAQVLGGLLFGAGFIVGGWCPGTAIAGIATGSKDAAIFAVGLLAGSLAYAELTPGIEAWYKTTTQGELTLPSLTGIDMGVWVAAFVAFLAFAAWGMKRVEARFGAWRPEL